MQFSLYIGVVKHQMIYTCCFYYLIHLVVVWLVSVNKSLFGYVMNITPLMFFGNFIPQALQM